MRTACFAVVLSCIAVGRSSAQQFAPVRLMPAGIHPTCVRTLDVNHDALPDLVCVNTDEDTLTVWTNNGSSGFGSNATIHVPFDSQTVAVADFNKDGWDDLVCASQQGRALTVFTNDGAGVLGSNAVLNPGLLQWYVVAADLNSDGSPDIVSTYELGGSTNYLRVLTNDGSGNFSFYSMTPVGLIPRAIAVADLNGDDRPDLVAVSVFYGDLTVITNTGSGFAVCEMLPVTDTPYSASPKSVVAADINGDGRPDLISANSGDNSLSVFTNSGTASLFGARSRYIVNSPYCVVPAELNGDGQMDLVVASFSGRLLLLTNSAGRFALAGTLPAGQGAYSVIATDLNNDGLLDFACANYVENSVSINFGAPKLAVQAVGSNALAVSWPFAAKGYSLQTNSDLSTMNWTDAGTTANDGTNWFKVVNTGAGGLYFRLSR